MTTKRTLRGALAAAAALALALSGCGGTKAEPSQAPLDETVALAVMDHRLTVADMDYYFHTGVQNIYQQEQYMAQLYAQYGMEYTVSFDPEADLKTQYVDEEQSRSYYDYFLEYAKSGAVEILGLSDAAQAAGYTLSATAQAELDAALEELDSEMEDRGYSSREEMLKDLYGAEMTEEAYLRNLSLYALASDYYTSSMEAMGNYTDQELEDYYRDNAAALDCYDYDYLYLDGIAQPQTDAEGNEIALSDEEIAAAMEAAKAQAEALVAQGGDLTAAAEGMEGVYASAQTDYPGSDLAGVPFEDWLMDDARAEGDTEMFEVENSGYYVVCFHSRGRSEAPGSADVRHILISTEERSDDEAKAEAERVMAEFTSGEQTAQRFGELAEQYSEDGRDETGALYSPGGLYEDVTTETGFVPEFLDWIFAEGRATGDVGIVKTDYGYHVMFLESQAGPKWKDQAREAKLAADQEAFFENATAGYEEAAVEGPAWSQVGLS